MLKNPKRSFPIIASLLFGVLLISACAPAKPESSSEQVETQQPAVEETFVIPDAPVDTPDETGTGTEEALPDEAVPNNVSGLSDAEINSLIFMREEEKLARDVYLALYDLWGLQLFNNIANSEQTHTDAVANLLEKFDIPDPTDTSPAGKFVNPDLQGLYDELTQIGAKSLGDALKVGAAIEEIDILDLQEALEIIEEESIRQVYENLQSGSENHLRAFTATFERQTGEVYQPQYLSQDAYDEIVSGTMGRRGQSNGRQP